MTFLEPNLAETGMVSCPNLWEVMACKETMVDAKAPSHTFHLSMMTIMIFNVSYYTFPFSKIISTKEEGGLISVGGIKYSQ